MKKHAPWPPRNIWPLISPRNASTWGLASVTTRLGAPPALGAGSQPGTPPSSTPWAKACKGAAEARQAWLPGHLVLVVHQLKGSSSAGPG